MRKTNHTPAIDLNGMAARTFPLVPRSKPACRDLDTRVARVCHRADLATRQGEETLTRAAEALNLAALILSDCGLPALARDLCWQQFEIFLSAGPFDAATAKLALQPLVNISRLLIRDGDGDHAYSLLERLFQAIKSHTDLVIDGREVRCGDLVINGDDHREVTRWLWSVLLADGTRALTRAGRWTDALRHVHLHKGIGHRLLDGRQVAILAHAAEGDREAADRTLTETMNVDAWEKAVAACLQVFLLRLDKQPAATEVAVMADHYLQLEAAPEHTVFQTRLGLAVIDLSPSASAASMAISKLARTTIRATDAYAAEEVLKHTNCRSSMTEHDVRTLEETVRASGLGCRVIPTRTFNKLMEAVKVSEAVLTEATSA